MQILNLSPAGQISLLLAVGAAVSQAATLVLNLPDTRETAGLYAAPLSVPVDLASFPEAASRLDELILKVVDGAQTERPEGGRAQFEPESPGALRGTLWWLMPPGLAGPRKMALEGGGPRARSPKVMQAQPDSVTGQWHLSESGRPVLTYNYRTKEPGELLAKVSPGNLKYARPRSDYIHPLYGADGETLTFDWSLDHPHHRGIYWAWPEVDYRGERGDLHALQRVFARPTGACVGQSGPLFARLEAENLWRWEDREPIVHERAILRVWCAGPNGRYLDLEFHFTALQDEVALARRGTTAYGGLNLRLAPVQGQQITTFTGPADAQPRRAYAELFGVFAGAKAPTGLVVLQHPANPDYPGDWVQFPEINWFQPTFPVAGTRYVLKQGQPLVLRYRLWMHSGPTGASQRDGVWSAYAHPPQVTLEK